MTENLLNHSSIKSCRKLKMKTSSQILHLLSGLQLVLLISFSGCSKDHYSLVRSLELTVKWCFTTHGWFVFSYQVEFIWNIHCRPVDRKISMTNFISRMPVKISGWMSGFKKCLLIQNIFQVRLNLMEMKHNQMKNNILISLILILMISNQ